MTDPTPTPTPKPLSARFIRSGLINLVAFGALYLAIRGFATEPDTSSAINIARIFANVLPIALICSAGLVIAGVVLRTMGK